MIAEKNERPIFDPPSRRFICPNCRHEQARADFHKAEPCERCGCDRMQRLAGTLIQPRYFIFAIVTGETMEERYFSMLPGVTAEPELGNEVKLPLEEGDPLTLLDEWEYSGGWLKITKRCVDYVTGSVWMEGHFLGQEENAK